MEKEKIRQLAEYAISECTQHSENGKWSISYEELQDRFSARIFPGNRNSRLLEEELRQREEINELIMTEDCIEMTCHLEYCQNCQQGGIKGAMNLLSLITNLMSAGLSLLDCGSVFCLICISLSALSFLLSVSLFSL